MPSSDVNSAQVGEGTMLVAIETDGSDEAIVVAAAVAVTGGATPVSLPRSRRSAVGTVVRIEGEMSCEARPKKGE